MGDTIGRTVPELYSELQLPLDPNHDAAAIQAIRSLIGASVGTEQDLAILLSEGLRDWADGSEPNPLVRKVVRAALAAGAKDFGALDGTQYFAIYERLRSGTADAVGLTHIVARRLLSRTTLIAHLLHTERLSCSQVSRLLHATESRLEVPPNAVQVIARKLSLLPVLDSSEAGQALWNADQSRSLNYFPDSDLLETCEVAGREIAKWAPEDDATPLLVRVSQASASADLFWPYLQILHWCTTALEFYDHPASYLYEFSPRGVAGNYVFSHYPTVTGNPVLNNAKAVASLDSTWARNRGSGDAHALVDLLTLLEALPFHARRQVARVLRAWLSRVIELHTVEPVLLDRSLDHRAFFAATRYIEKDETNTRGVIEQRLVDALATLAYESPGWRAKGIGDGVNASNLSRQKLGDIEFTNVNERTAIALEAHGGNLSRPYVRDHQRSLSRIIDRRLADSWADLDDPSAWTIRVIFVAHSRDEQGLPTEEVMHGVTVRYEYLDYRQLHALGTEGRSLSELTEVFRRLVVDALNRDTVRQDARDKFATLANTGTAARTGDT